MKILLGLIAIIISTYVGYIASSKHVKKKKFYDSFNEFNKRLINEVAFSQKSLIDILNEFDNQSDFYLIFSRFFYKQKFELNMNYLSNDDKIFIKTYLSNIGASDKKTQLNFLNEISVQIKKNYDITCENYKKYKTVYIKIGILIGLIIFIILL